MTQTGVWLVGARGNVATTTVAGARAIARDLVDRTGMVTARPPASDLELPPVSDLVFGGHEVQSDSLLDVATELDAGGTIEADVVDAVADDLRRIDDRITVGTTANRGAAVESLADETDDSDTLEETVETIRGDYRDFVRTNDLDRLVVVDAASTEPPLGDPDQYDTPAAVERAIETDDAGLPNSSLYAYAALVDGYPYVNFTPSTGSDLGGLRALAEEENVPHAGRDGKTGETLVKSALAPMFANRNLRVHSWEGHNVLGNTDGLVLETDENEAGKRRTKGGVLESLLPGDTHSRVRIDYTPSLGDRKTAWDYIDFEGFLGSEMTLQFTWEASDSALAAPLVLDLVRLVAYADEQGEGGVQPHLASFFKDPMGVGEHDLSRQFASLEAYVEEHRPSGGERR